MLMIFCACRLAATLFAAERSLARCSHTPTLHRRARSPPPRRAGAACAANRCVSVCAHKGGTRSGPRPPIQPPPQLQTGAPDRTPKLSCSSGSAAQHLLLRAPRSDLTNWHDDEERTSRAECERLSQHRYSCEMQHCTPRREMHTAQRTGATCRGAFNPEAPNTEPPMLKPHSRSPGIESAI